VGWQIVFQRRAGKDSEALCYCCSNKPWYCCNTYRFFRSWERTSQLGILHAERAYVSTSQNKSNDFLEAAQLLRSEKLKDTGNDLRHSLSGQNPTYHWKYRIHARSLLEITEKNSEFPSCLGFDWLSHIFLDSAFPFPTVFHLSERSASLWLAAGFAVVSFVSLCARRQIVVVCILFVLQFEISSLQRQL